MGWGREGSGGMGEIGWDRMGSGGVASLREGTGQERLQYMPGFTTSPTFLPDIFMFRVALLPYHACRARVSLINVTLSRHDVCHAAGGL